MEVRRAHVFSGDYPSQLLGLWDKFSEEKGTENERPDKLGHDQTYIALEFNNAGDLGYQHNYILIMILIRLRSREVCVQECYAGICSVEAGKVVS